MLLTEQDKLSEKNGSGSIPSEKTVTNPKRNGGLRIAIVDDAPSLVETYSIVLRTKGHDVVATATNGEQMLAWLDDNRAKNIDVAIIDYRLGNGIDGLTLAQLLLKKNPHIKIIIASADESLRNEPNGSGFFVLRKPFSAMELRASVAQFLQQ